MSPECEVNSLYHSVPVRGDYKHHKKNEIVVDLFLNTSCHSPPSQRPFFWPSFLWPRPPGSATFRVWATCKQWPLLLDVCWPMPNFHLNPHLCGRSEKKPPAGMLQWAAVSILLRFRLCHQKSHSGTSWTRKSLERIVVTHLHTGSDKDAQIWWRIINGHHFSPCLGHHCRLLWLSRWICQRCLYAVSALEKKMY